MQAVALFPQSQTSSSGYTWTLTEAGGSGNDFNLCAWGSPDW